MNNSKTAENQQISVKKYAERLQKTNIVDVIYRKSAINVLDKYADKLNLDTVSKFKKLLKLNYSLPKVIVIDETTYTKINDGFKNYEITKSLNVEKIGRKINVQTADLAMFELERLDFESIGCVLRFQALLSELKQAKQAKQAESIKQASKASKPKK